MATATPPSSPSSSTSASHTHEFKPQPWRDKRLAYILGNLLRAGVMMSAGIVLCGAAIYLSRHAHEPANYRAFHSEPPEYRTIPGVIHSVFRDQGRGRGLIQLGLLLLIATPIVRVALSIVGFAIERDQLYVGFTVVVLAILLYSLLGSGIGL